ncbi:MAG: hypothetical protein IJ155_11405 [Prevotella sp.]|nr:hypothetical protein [Prevotella sp.]
MTLSLKNSNNEEVWGKTGEAINNTGSWDLTQLHCFNIGNLAAGDYTLTLSITSTDNTGSYAGNWGDFCFHTATEVPLPTSKNPYLNMVEGSFVNTNYNNDNVINYIRPDGYIDNLVFYNATDGYYMFNFKNDQSNAGYSDAQIKLTVYDAFTGTQEGEYTISASTSSATNKDLITSPLTTGWKKIRITFVSAKAKEQEDKDRTGNTKKYLFNFANAYFSAFNAQSLPMYGTSVLDLSQGSMTSSSNPRYSSSSGTNNEISYIYNGGYADNFYVMIDGEETAYYDLRTTTSNYNNKGGTFKVTITNVETGTTEVNAVESPEITSNNQSIVMPLTGMLSPGLKKIRFDFVKEGESAWLYNIKDICFYKRSLNESYDYTAVAATGVDMVLTRSIAANSWSTIVLPFAMTSDQITSTFGDGTKVAQLTGISGNNLTFSSVTSMNANEPYMIRVPAAFSTATIEGVTVVAGTPSKTTVSGVDFIGSYDAVTEIPATDATYTYYFIKDNQLHKTAASGTANKMRGTRAYFKIPGTTAARLTGFTIDDESTGIETVHSSQFIVHSYYNLNAQRVAQPTRGLYIVNGKKVIIK